MTQHTSTTHNKPRIKDRAGSDKRTGRDQKMSEDAPAQPINDKMDNVVYLTTLQTLLEVAYGISTGT
jgi:hypothetical protein